MALHTHRVIPMVIRIYLPMDILPMGRGPGGRLRYTVLEGEGGEVDLCPKSIAL